MNPPDCNNIIEWEPFILDNAGSFTEKILSNEVHIWKSTRFFSSNRLNKLSSLLSEYEHNQANSYKFSYLKERFIASHGILRLILSRYINQEPSQIIYKYGKYGKPALKEKNVEFNISHSSTVSLFSIKSKTSVGIDIEKIQNQPSLLEMANEFLTEHEWYNLSILQTDERLRAFYNAWTRKEAILKATGKGLYSPLKELKVTFFSGQKPKLLSINGSIQAANEWKLHSFTPIRGYIAALATKTPLLKIRYFELIY